MKVCKKCQQNKPKSDYYFTDSRKKHLHTNCKSCFSKISSERGKKESYKAKQRIRQKNNPLQQRNAHLKYNYGITLEDYNKMFAEQGGLCAICKKPETQVSRTTGKPHYMTVDHCHKTKKVRGLLCRHCNAAIGMLKEDLDIINNVITYLGLQ